LSPEDALQLRARYVWKSVPQADAILAELLRRQDL
jgi:hypothetical protein